MKNFDYVVWSIPWRTYIRFWSDHPDGWMKKYTIELIPYWGA